MTVFHLVRHAEHGLLGRVLTGRMPGVPLSEQGIAQAAALAERFAKMEIAAVLSSPVQRARETAEPIAAVLGLPVTIEAGLDEIDFGDWTGLGFDALDGQPGWERWNRSRSIAACPGGESMLGAQARSVMAVRRAAEAHPEGQVILVSHQDVLKALLAHILDLSLDRLDRYELAPASRSVLQWCDGWARVDGLNLPV